MNYILTIFLLILLLVNTRAFAQSDPGKVFTAKVKSGQSGPVTKRDKDEIIFQAKNKIDNLANLLNALNTSGLSESERNSITQNSYLPNQDQIFFNDAVVIEDDIDPKHIAHDKTADLKVDRYLRDLDLFYVKSDTATIKFSRIIASPVLEGKEYPYIKVFFNSLFTSRHNQFAVPYQHAQRVAELRADKVDGKWRTFITHLGFIRPGEGLTELNEPVIVQEFTSKPRITGTDFLFRNTENTLDSITVRWNKHWLNIIQSSTKIIPVGFFQRNFTGANSQDQVSIRLLDKDNLLTFRRVDGTSLAFRSIDYLKKRKRQYTIQGWLQIVAGTLALGTSYVGYSSLHRSYDDYANRLNALNADYTVWKSLSQQTGDAPAAPMSFTSYAQPGIYAVYGGGIAGSGLLINGIRQLLKARKIRFPARP